MKRSSGTDRGGLISIVTPCFNAALTLQRAHYSLLLQDCQWQHVIVDDGSTDESSSVIEALARDRRVVCAKTGGRRGAGAALNTGLRLAEGDLIAFLDADDEYLPHHLSSRAAAMKNRPEVDIFWGGVEVIAARHEDTLVPDVSAGFGLVPVVDCVVQGTIFARRRVFEELTFSEDPRMWWQDYDFIKRSGERFQVERFHEPTYRYYRNSGASTVDRAKATWPAERPEHCAGSPARFPWN